MGEQSRLPTWPDVNVLKEIQQKGERINEDTGAIIAIKDSTKQTEK
jgi:hypothetical protein